MNLAQRGKLFQEMCVKQIQRERCYTERILDKVPIDDNYALKVRLR